VRSRRLAWAVVGGVVAAAVVYVVHCRGQSPPSQAHDAGVAIVSRSRARLRDLIHQPRAALSGQVTAGGTPAPGAIACVIGDRSDREIECTTAGTDGRYAFGELDPGAFKLWASATGYAATRWRSVAGDDRLVLATGEHRIGIDLALVAGGAELAGTVHDTRGHRIPDALVHGFVGPDGDAAFTARTGADGTFTGRVLATTSVVSLTATADGYVDAELSTFAPRTGLELELVPEATVSGIVVEPGSETPLADVKVSIGPSDAITDEHGRFRVAKLSPGRYKPTARGIGRYGEAAESVLVRVGTSVDDVVIEAHPVAVVAGRIAISIDSDRACPADDGGVTLSRRGSPDYYFARTIGDGDVILEGVVPGSYGVAVTCRGFVPATSYEDLVVGDSDVEDVVWKVEPGGRIAGRVVGTDRAPMANVQVYAYREGYNYRATDVTEADGRFSLVGLPAGAVEVEARADGRREPVKTTVTVPGAADVELVVDLPRYGTITGVVVDPDGRPLPGVDVETRATDPDNNASGGAHTGARGEFAIEMLPAGAYDVSAVTDWNRWSDTRVEDARAAHASVSAGGTARVRLVMQPDRGTITGTVVDAAGAPVADAAIDAAPAGPELRRLIWKHLAWTAADGTFRIERLPDGVFAVRARIEGANVAVVNDVALGARIRLVMRPTAALSGVVVGPTGGPVDDVQLEVKDREHDVSRTERLFRTAGKFAFRDLPAGTYRLTADDDRQTSITVALREGEIRDDLRVVARPRYAIRGRLVAADRRPLAGWTIEVPHQEAIERSSTGGTVTIHTVETTITNARGEFLVQGLAGKEVTISAADRTRDPETSMVELRTVALAGASPVDVGELIVPAKP